MHHNTTPSCNLFHCVEIHHERFYFWCCDTCMTSGMPVTPTNAELGERRKVSNISDAISVAGEGCPYHKYLLRNTAEAHRQFRPATWAVLVTEWRLRHLTRKITLFGIFSTLAAVECASICDGCCCVFDGRSTSLSKRTEANDMGCDTDRVPLGSTVLAGTSQR